MTTGSGGPANADAALGSAVVRVTGPDGAVGGVGFLVAADLALTCAHVVADALGLERGLAAAPAGALTLDRPLSGSPGSTPAEVAHWVPLRDDGTGDIAVLRLAAPVPGATPLAMASPPGVWEHPVRVAGFPASSPGGVWHAGRLRGPTAEGWVQLSGADRQGVPVDKGFSGSPVWDERAGAVVGMVVAAQLSGTRQSFMIPTRTLLAEVPALTPVLTPASPFRGLETYREADAAVYFGRDAEAADVTALLNSGPRPCVALIGPSGCGKSSLALAGVAPRLRARGHEVLVVRAADGLPVRTALAAELARLARPRRHAGPAALRELEESLTRHGLPVAARLALGDGRAGRLLVVLDQAEAVLAGPRRGGDDGVGLLFPDPHPPGLRVLLTLRTDFTDAAVAHPVLGPALARADVRALLPMTRAQMSEVILRPLARVPSVSYDPGLVARMLDDAGTEPGALPLLGFVLARLWDEQALGRLRFDSYEEIGGVRGALGRHAEAAWRECVGEADREEALRLLTALVRLLPGSEAPLRGVLGRAEAGEERWRIAGRLAQRRILVVGGDPERGQTVELAHEALIGAWPTLARQVARDRQFLTWRAGLRHDLDRWHALGEPRDQLLTGAPLDTAVAQTATRGEELSAQEREFLRASVARRTEEAAQARRAGRLKRAGVVVLSLALVATLVASWKLYGANGRLDEDLRRGASPQLAQLAARLDDVSLGTSALMSAAAYRTSPQPEAQTALFEQYVRMRQVDRIALEGRGEVRNTILSEDGRHVTIGLSSGDVLGADLGTGPPRLSNLREGTTRLVTATGDGRTAAASSPHGVITVGIRQADDSWRTVKLRGAEQVRDNARPADDLRFDASGQRLLAAIPAEGVSVWEAVQGTRVGATLTPPSGWTVSNAWFGPDGDTVIGRIVREGAAAGASGRLVRWQLSDGRLDEQSWGTQETGPVTVSADGSTLVRCTADGVLQAWDLAGEPKVKRQYSTGQLGLVCPLFVPRLDRTGRFLLNPAQRFGGSLGRYRCLVLDLQEGLPATLDLPAATQQDEFVAGSATLPAISLAGPPEAMKVAISAAGTIVVAEVPRPTGFDSAMLTSLIRTVDVDHNRVASVDADGGTLRLWDLTTRRQLAALRPSAPLARLYASFSPDGKRLLTVTADGLGVLVWDLKGADGPPLTEVRRLALPAPPGIDPSRADPRTGRTPAWVVVSFDGDDHALVSAVSYVSRWDLKTGRAAGETYRPPLQDPIDVSTAAASVFAAARPGHHQAAVRAPGDRIQIWDFEKGTADTIPFKEEDGYVSQMLFDPSGRKLAVLTKDGRLQIRDVEGKEPTRTLAYQGTRWLNGFPDASTLSTFGTVNSFTFWDLARGAEKYHFTPGYGGTVDWSADGRRLAWMDGSTVQVLPLDPEAWRARACRLASRPFTDGERRLLPPGSRSDACAGLKG
ncbi:WD40 repeat protein [Streptomyces sp. 3211.6]|uniref:nSTAND1 domain-containing NTPase n=1 Tax=Streptomyces sp. 3211.6 TaxID=1938845 RepID=UPI000EAE909E|nr:trypsin-like peptidase domain-containing protein [Streptomyces sp. 3211.6]RKT03414.1 WD40 repeat protein [Streptomyces sp. 3211.6]